jgi:hypothetical protein
MGLVALVGIERGHAGEHVLVGLAGHQIAIAQRRLAEFRQQRVAAVIDLHAGTAVHLHGLKLVAELHFRLGGALCERSHAAHRPLTGNDARQAGLDLTHIHRFRRIVQHIYSPVCPASPHPGGQKIATRRPDKPSPSPCPLRWAELAPFP